MAFDASVNRISKLLNDSIFYIPRNQRQYVWTTSNWNDLLEDVRFSTNTKVAHFIGSVVLQKGEEENGLETYRIIDGQQRMITITVFLLAIMMLLKQNNQINDFEGMIKYVEATDKKNSKHMIMDLEEYQSLELMLNTLKTEDGSSLSKMTSNAFANRCSLHPEKDKQILDCYKFFYAVVKEEYDSEKSLDNILKTKDSLLDMRYVHIVADTEEDSYTVFEILNARGTELEDSELLKNYIMRYIRPERDRDKVKTYWHEMDMLLGKHIKSFIKHYAVHRYTTEKQELRQKPYRNIRQNCGREGVHPLLFDIRQKANFYYKIITPLKASGENECTETEKKVFSFLKSTRQEQVRPLLLSLMHHRASEEMSEAEYNDSLNFIYRFIICYTVIGEEKSNKIRDIIYKYAPIIENRYSYEDLASLCSELKGKIPNITFFLNAFQNLGYSSRSSVYSTDSKKKKVQSVLYLLEEHWGSINANTDFTIEHILPDSENEDNARIGNLLPLEESLNRRAKDKPLEEKLPIYRESQYLSVKKFLETRSKKPDFDPNDRAERLAEVFYKEILGK